MRIQMLLLSLLSSLPVAAGAEVAFAAVDGLHIRHQFRIAAPADHTRSGTRESLSLRAEAGDCYCEQWAGGSAEHGRGIMVIPERMLRFDAALGPFQEMAISGVLTITLAEQDGVTTADVSYRVSGDEAHKLDGIAPIVDHRGVPYKYRALHLLACSPHRVASIRFVFLEPAFCPQLPSDPQSPGAPLPLS